MKVQVPVETLQKTAAFVEGAIAALEQADAQAKRVTEVGPGMIDKLAADGHIAESMKSAKLDALARDPIGTLAGFVTQLSETAKSAASVGKPATSADSAEHKLTADEVFERRLFRE